MAVVQATVRLHEAVGVWLCWKVSAPIGVSLGPTGMCGTLCRPPHWYWALCHRASYMSQALQSTHKPASRSMDRRAAMCAVTLGLLVCLASCWPYRRAGKGAIITSSAACLQIGMWERITAALAELRPEALTPGSAEGEALGEEDPAALVEYEGMLVSAAAAQRRR